MRAAECAKIAPLTHPPHPLPPYLGSPAHQQQPDDLAGAALLPIGSAVLPCLVGGAVAILFLISDAIVMNACSTFVADLALVSRKGTESESAKSLAVWNSTCFLVVRSLLLPTSSLFTPSVAYLQFAALSGQPRDRDGRARPASGRPSRRNPDPRSPLAAACELPGRPTGRSREASSSRC